MDKSLVADRFCFYRHKPLVKKISYAVHFFGYCPVAGLERRCMRGRVYLKCRTLGINILKQPKGFFRDLMLPELVGFLDLRRGSAAESDHVPMWRLRVYGDKNASGISELVSVLQDEHHVEILVDKVSEKPALWYTN